VSLAAPFQSLAEGLRGSLRLGLAVWGALLGLVLLWCAAFGRTDALFDADEPLGLSSSARTQVVVALLIAFLVATRRHLVQRAAGNWAPLQPLTGLAPEAFEGFVEREMAEATKRRPWVDALGALLGVSVVLLSRGGSELSEEIRRPLFLWALGANALSFALMARAAASSLLGQSVARIAAALRGIDLLDLRPLRCFGQQGLRSAFYWAGGSSIASLLAWDLDRVAPLAAILALTLALASYALLEPVHAVRHHILRAKQAELEAVRARIRRAREALLAGGEAAGLPGLLAYEARIERVSEWPFDAPTLIRFGALALLATGSWLAGALVERGLDAILG